MAKRRFKKPKRNLADVQNYAVRRSDTLAITYGVVLFQFSALILLSLKTSPVDSQALAMALTLPAATLMVSVFVPRIWPIDQVLLSLALFLCSIGIVILKDIARSPSTPQSQLLFFGAGLGAMLVAVLFIRYLRNWERYIPLGILAGLAAVASPLVFGQWKFGAKNWIEIPGIHLSLQPSEFAKLLLLLVLAAAFSNRAHRRNLIFSLGFSVSCCLLLLYSRDLGSLLVYFLVTLMMFFGATSNLFLTGAGLGAGVVGSVAAYHLFPHVKKRVEVWQNPWSDPADKGYQIVQALIAIGSGGLFGMGLGLGLPRYVPLYSSDFIFAAIFEEFGLVFSVCMLAAYVLIILRGVSVAMSARTGFHALLAFGAVAMLGVQTFVIVGGVIKMIPLTGVTLPFISAGGSSLVSSMMALGMLLGVSSINAEQEAEDIEKLKYIQEADV